MAALAAVLFAMLAFPAAGKPEDKEPGRGDARSAEARDRENPPQSADRREATADEPAAKQSEGGSEPSKADDRDKQPQSASSGAKDEPAKDESAKHEPAKHEPAKHEPAKDGPGKDEPGPTTAASEHQSPAASPEVQPAAPAVASASVAGTRWSTASAVPARRRGTAEATSPDRPSTSGPTAELDVTAAAGSPAVLKNAGARAAGRRSGPRSRPRTDERSRVPATVRQIVGVIPKPLYELLGLLAALSLAFAAASALTARRAHRLERERRRLVADVGLLQSALHPHLPEDLNLASISAVYRPAEGPAAGGDFYDAFPLPRGRTGIVLGSLQSHGRAVLPLTMLVRYTLRTQLEGGLEPRLALENADRVLLDQLRGQLAGAVVATFDPAVGYLTYAVAGHPQPVIAGGDLRPVTAVGSRPLGTGRLAGSRQTTVALGAGTAAIFHTDGLLTALPDIQLGTLGDEATADDVLLALPRRQPVARDLTVLVLRPHAGATRPRAAQYEQLVIQGSGLHSARDFLDACGLDGHDAAAVLRETRSIITAHGAAMLEARVGAKGATVSVAAPPAPSAPDGVSGYLSASR